MTNRKMWQQSKSTQLIEKARTADLFSVLFVTADTVVLELEEIKIAPFKYHVFS